MLDIKLHKWRYIGHYNKAKNTVINIFKDNNQKELSVKKEDENASYCNVQESLKNAKECTYLIGDTQGHGSGFLIQPNILVTNYHVIENSEDGYVDVWYNDNFNQSKIIGFSVKDDIALVEIGDNQKVCFFADSLKLDLAETVYAVGWPNSPYGESTITKGIFSRYVTENGIQMIQTDTPINQGNSGGPLINSCGVIGINTSKIAWITNDSPSEGIGFAINSQHAQEVITNILQNKDDNPAIPVEKITQKKETEQSEPRYIGPPLNVNDYVSYNYEEVIFWEQRKIQDENVLESWEKGIDSITLDQDKLDNLIDILRESLDISERLWDGYTNSKITYAQAINLKEEYIKISRERSVLSKELNYESSINAFNNCIKAWEELEEEYDQEFNEQKEKCEEFIEIN